MDAKLPRAERSVREPADFPEIFEVVADYLCGNSGSGRAMPTTFHKFFNVFDVLSRQRDRELDRVRC